MPILILSSWESLSEGPSGRNQCQKASHKYSKIVSSCQGAATYLLNISGLRRPFPGLSFALEIYATPFQGVKQRSQKGNTIMPPLKLASIDNESSPLDRLNLFCLRSALILFPVLAFSSHPALSQSITLDVKNNIERKLVAIEPANPQPSFEYKFMSWGSGFMVRLTRKQTGDSPTLARLSNAWSEPNEAQVRYSLGIKMAMPLEPSKDSRQLYSYLLSSSSGLLVEDLNQRLPILKVFSSGLNLSVDLMNPFGDETAPATQTTFSYVLDDKKGGQDLILVPLVVQRAPETPKTSSPSSLPTWKFKGSLKPSFSSGPGLTIVLNEVTGFYQLEKSLVGGTTFNQKISIPIPQNRISTNFIANKAQMTEIDPIYFQSGRSLKFQYFHIEKKNNVIFAKNFHGGKIEFVTTYTNQFSSLKSATMGYTSQI